MLNLEGVMRLRSVLNVLMSGVCAIGLFSTAAVAQDECVDLQLIGSYGEAYVGADRTVAAYHEGYAYLLGQPSSWRGLEVIDLRDPSSPTLVASYTIADLEFGGSSIAVQGDLVFLGGYRELVVFDVAQGQVRSVHSTSRASIKDISVEGDLVYLGLDWYSSNHDGGFEILDVSDPSSPVVLSSVRYELDAGYGGVSDIQIKDSVLYVVHEELGLLRYCVQDPHAPELLGEYQLPDGRYDYLSLSGDVAYLGTSQGDIEGVLSLDVTDPSSVSLAGSSLEFIPLIHAPATAIRGDYMVLGYEERFETRVLNISNPFFPVLEFGTRSVFGWPAFIDDETLVLMNGHGLRVYDLSAGFSGDCLPIALCDFNADGMLNMYDFSRFLEAYLGERVDADLNHDGVLNRFDVSVFILCYNEFSDL
jgi:hypothetical protein